ncbi:RloB family protein [Flagellimonas halotolerans]|uniref:RloB family protein n=1 Tax=Flagellimonas halotolerans TaxID=3112164 RepID=A0ABU6IRW9_9FLAO|nr:MULTISPECIES: RloB family protein [unclassified Allomuricauda]MEC3965806.1 RloB family protein [Muricauda sp. SYSU M86414]MEC4265728.1 RloB family protein [Muricauda sp. SYSU M84420]
MARKIKIPNERLKRFAREEQKRKKNIRNKRKYYLIVCEGEATEPNYFEGLKQDLPKGVLTAYQIDIEGTGRNTQSLVDEALRLKGVYEKSNTRQVDKLWVVFDKDSFSSQDFNAAIQRCGNDDIGCAWSNEAFELWYLLHFQYYENAILRKDFKELIENNLKPVLGEVFRYEKNNEQMYALLKEYGSQEDAIRNGKRLSEKYGQRQDYANHNPCTMVYKLIEELKTLTTID